MKNNRGQTLVELLMLITMISILAVGSTLVITDTLNETRFRETRQKLVAIRKALVGDPTFMEGGVRSNFGYQGDVGALPTTGQGIAALLADPSGISLYAVDSTTHVGSGWNGPYLDARVSGIDYTIDGWGNPFSYNPSASPPTVVSYGADGATGGTGFDQDITMELPVNVTSGTVFGLILNGGAQWSGSADIDLNSPDGTGNIQTVTASIASSANGLFSFSGVTMGVRSVTVYIPSKSSPTQTLGPILFAMAGSFYLIPAKFIDVTH